MRSLVHSHRGFTLLEVLLALTLSAGALAVALFLLDVFIREVNQGPARTWEQIEQVRLQVFLDQSLSVAQHRGEVRWVPTHSDPVLRELDWALSFPLRSSMLGRDERGRTVLPERMELGWQAGEGLVLRAASGDPGAEMEFIPLMREHPFVGAVLYTYDLDLEIYEELINPGELDGVEPQLRIIQLEGPADDGSEDQWIYLRARARALLDSEDPPLAPPGPPPEAPPPPPPSFEVPPVPSGRPPGFPRDERREFDPGSVPDFIPEFPERGGPR